MDLSPGRLIVDSDTRRLGQQNNLDFTEKFIFAHPAYKNLMLLEEKTLEIQSLKDKLVEQFNDDDEDDDFQQNVRYYLKELELERANLDEKKFDVIEEIKTDLENANLIGDRNQIETHSLLFTGGGKLKNLGDTDVGFFDKKKFGAQGAWGESQGDVSSANKKLESTRKISSQAERQGNKVQKKKRKASQRVGSYQTGVAKYPGTNMHKFFKASFNQAKGSYYDFKKTNSSVHDSTIKNNENYRSERGNYDRLPLDHERGFDTFNNYSSNKKSAKPSVRRNKKPAVKLNKSKSPLQISNRLKIEYDHMPRYIVDNENYNRSGKVEEDYNRENEDGFMRDENNSPLPEIVKVHQGPIGANSKQDS